MIKLQSSGKVARVKYMLFNIFWLLLTLFLVFYVANWFMKKGKAVIAVLLLIALILTICTIITFVIVTLAL